MSDQQISVFSDFNGTVTDRDTLAALLESYGRHDLVDRVEQARRLGLLSLRERIAYQARGLTCSLVEADARLRSLVTFDSSFVSFYRRCVAERIACVILSSGIEPLIVGMLERYGVSEISVFANAVDARPDGWRITFRDQTPEGNAKAPYVLATSRDGYRTIIVGDNESDFDMALAADIRFAKRASPLESYLRQLRQPHYTFDTFHDVLTVLMKEDLFRA